MGLTDIVRKHLKGISTAVMPFALGLGLDYVVSRVSKNHLDLIGSAENIFVGNAYAQEIDFFPDDNLENAIRARLDIPEGPLTDNNLVRLRFLSGTNRGIRSLEGLEHCTNLTNLHLYGNQITDISGSLKIKS